MKDEIESINDKIIKAQDEQIKIMHQIIRVLKLKLSE